MAFTIHDRFCDHEGCYGDIHWCSYADDPKRYLCKKLKRPDVSLEIEAEAARRMRFLPTVYKVRGLERAAGATWLVSEYIDGVLLACYRGPRIVNLFLHLLCTLEEMREKRICHNDIHGGNIVVVASSLHHVTYRFNGKTKKIRVFGVLPILIDFGLCRIDDFELKPMISGLSRGNLASLVFDPRFDKLRLISLFARILPDRKMRQMAAVTGRPTLKKMALWIRANVYKIWEPINYELEFIYKAVFDAIDYDVTGPLLSFPDLPEPPTPPQKQQYLRALNERGASSGDLMTAMIEALRVGREHPLHGALCVLSSFLKRGIETFLADRPDFMDTIPLETQWLSFILSHYPDFRVHAEDQMTV